MPVTAEYQDKELVTSNQKPAPRFYYYLYDTQTPVSHDDPAWQQQLPLSRHFAAKNDDISISHGDYFRIIRRFFEKDDFDLISRALGQRLQKKVKSADIRKIRVCLAKHGEFYHPACIEVSVGQQSAGFVLNVAVSETGIRTIYDEYRNLKKLNDEFTQPFIPRVYGFGEINTAGGRKLPMFLGDWLQGYHEFHISGDPAGQAGNILVWDGGESRSLLSTAQQAEIYRQAAKILAYYYNIESFEQIFAWHHAAGDFIVRVENSIVDLKLISVRRYAPLLKNQGHLETDGTDVEMILQALLLFFLSLSIRMRLDRIDGVGDIVWANRLAVAATLEGFFEGLALKPQIPSLPDTIDRCFAYFLSVCSSEDIGDLCRSVVDALDRRAPETVFVRQNLNEHITSLARSFEQLLHPS
jgi:hypothetical protein